MTDLEGQRLSVELRIQHRVKENWLKMYDKAGSVLRVEMVINNPEEFKVRKKVSQKNKEATEKGSINSSLAFAGIDRGRRQAPQSPPRFHSSSKRKQSALFEFPANSAYKNRRPAQ